MTDPVLSIRIMFSIADIQSEEEFDDTEAEGEESEPPIFPLRASLSITKVCLLTILQKKKTKITYHTVKWSWCSKHRHGLSGGYPCHREHLIL